MPLQRATRVTAIRIRSFVSRSAGECANTCTDAGAQKTQACSKPNSCVPARRVLIGQVTCRRRADGESDSKSHRRADGNDHLVTVEKVIAAHAKGLQVVPWTANTPVDWDKLIRAGVDAIISDDPSALIAHLKKQGLR